MIYLIVYLVIGIIISIFAEKYLNTITGDDVLFNILFWPITLYYILKR